MSEEKQTPEKKEEERPVIIRLKETDEVIEDPTKRPIEQDIVLEHTPYSLLEMLKQYELQEKQLVKQIEGIREQLEYTRKGVKIYKSYIDHPVVKALLDEEEEYLAKRSAKAKADAEAKKEAEETK